MDIRPTPAQELLIRRVIEAGRFANAEDVMRDALALWEERERRRAEILASVHKAKASIAQGEGRVITEESMAELADDVHQRGLARLAAEKRMRG